MCMCRTARCRSSSATMRWARTCATSRWCLRRRGRAFRAMCARTARPGTRNYIGVLSTVNCSATVCKFIAEHFPRGGSGRLPERRRHRRHHPCHRLRHGRPRRGLRHPAAHAVGLRQAPQLRRHPDDRPGLRGDADRLPPGSLQHQARALFPHHDACRATGGTRAHHRARARHDQGDAAARQRLRPPAGLRQRDQPGAAMRRLGRLFRHHRQPGAGLCADLLVRHGGTAILSETPEIYGAEHLLTRRAISRRGGREADRAHPLVGGVLPASMAAR